MGTFTLEMTGGGIRPMRLMGDRDLAIVVGRFTFSSSYTTGGESFPASSCDMQELLFVVPTPAPSAGTGNPGQMLFATWNGATNKLMAIAPSGFEAANVGAREVTHGSNLAAYTVRFLAVGYR